MSEPASDRVVVIGGGILGASTAASLARSGTAVTLLTSGALADGASGRSIAWLNSSGARSAEYHYLRVLALDRYRTWSARHPESRSYLRFDGALKWAGAGESLRETYAFERENGYDSVWVARADVPRIAPDVDPAAVHPEGAIFNPGEGWVNLPDLVPALLADAVDNGAEVRDNVGEVRVQLQGDAVAGVVLADGSSLGASRVVLATGADVPAQLAALGVHVPDASPAAFVLFTEPVDKAVTTVLNTPRVAVRPLPDGRVVLDADWAEKSVTVGADGAIVVPEDSVQGLLEAASEILSGHPALRPQRVAAGRKPIPGDGEPVVGAVPSVPGLYTVFTHSGATLGLILGELLAEEIISGEPSPVLSTFGVGRFEGTASPAEVSTGAWVPVRRAEIGDID